jgi:hypothetical protein
MHNTLLKALNSPRVVAAVLVIAIMRGTRLGIDSNFPGWVGMVSLRPYNAVEIDAKFGQPYRRVLECISVDDPSPHKEMPSRIANILYIRDGQRLGGWIKHILRWENILMSFGLGQRIEIGALLRAVLLVGQRNFIGAVFSRSSSGIVHGSMELETSEDDTSIRLHCRNFIQANPGKGDISPLRRDGDFIGLAADFPQQRSEYSQDRRENSRPCGGFIAKAPAVQIVHWFLIGGCFLGAALSFLGFWCSAWIGLERQKWKPLLVSIVSLALGMTLTHILWLIIR